MIVHTDYGRVLLTAHAIERYRSRIDRRADAGDIAKALWVAKLHASKPSWVRRPMETDEITCGYVVGDGWTMPLIDRAADVNPDRRGADFDFKAVTCVKRPTVSKAEVRARREQAREDAWAA